MYDRENRRCEFAVALVMRMRDENGAISVPKIRAVFRPGLKGLKTINQTTKTIINAEIRNVSRHAAVWKAATSDLDPSA